MHARPLIFAAAFSVVVTPLCAAPPSFPTSKTAASADKISWKRTELDTKFRSEGCAVGDFNNDGKMDIAAGSVFYAAPDWKMQLIKDKADEHDPHKYSISFCNFAEDLNGDGAMDLIVVGFPGKETLWYENPKGAAGPWKEHVLAHVTNNESPDLRDVDGDGKRELVFATNLASTNPDGPERKMAIAKRTADAYAPWQVTTISAPGVPGSGKFNHGIGSGDINGDGRVDVLSPKGWWECPAAPSSDSNAEWKFHAANFGPDCAHMYVYDFDGDGDADVATSSAHNKGVWWYEQTKEGWKQHEISSDFSQSHALALADINGDGLPDLVTGKRWWAHGPKGDVDPSAPRVLYWFELQRKDGKAVWTAHEIDHNSGVGTQFDVADVNGDGLLDIAVANKSGVFLLEQVREGK